MPWIISGAVTAVVVVGAVAAVFRTLVLVGTSDESDDEVDRLVSA